MVTKDTAKTGKLIGLVLFLSLGVWWYAQAQAVYYPAAGMWDSRPASTLGFNEEKLREAVAFSEANEYKASRDLRLAIIEAYAHEPYHEIVGPTKKRGGPAGLIIRNGYIVARWGDCERVDMTFSVTKSFLSTVAGVARDKKLITGIDEPVHKYVWDNTFAGSHNEKITWRHLLDQSSDWSGELFGMHDWADRPPREGDVSTWSRRTLNEPGSVYKYNDVRVNVLAYSLLHVLRKPLPVVLKESIMDPIGASTTWRWYGYDNMWVNMDGVQVQSVSGGGHSGGGMFINTYDMARFGYLFLRKGKWNGAALISENWVSSVYQSSKANESYGLLWWINKGPSKWQGVSESVYYAAGFGGNYIVIDREHDLVVVTRWLEPSKIGMMMKLVTEAIGK
jgi:CubicO group peptidase (beta-lactamase class C family)